MIEHHLQRDIIVRLAHAPSLRFSQLKPAGLESNSFMYHLHEVIKRGIVMQRDNKSYQLTPTGLAYVNGLTFTTNRPRRQPKQLAIFALQRADEQFLMARRLQQPHLGTWMLPSGKQHYGELSSAHAQREVSELGITADVTMRGHFELRITRQAQAITHLVARVYDGHYDGPLPRETTRFVYGWRSAESSEALTPGTAELIAGLKFDGPIDLTIDSADDTIVV